MKYNNVTAIIILYNPDLDNLKRSIIALKSQVGKIFLVDNTINNKKHIEFVKDFWEQNIEYFPLGKNEGVAKAQNIGIQHALEKKSEYVLIMDQDSVASENMVSQLMESLDLLKGKGLKIGVIGPTPINIQTKKPYEPRIRKKSFFLEDNKTIVKVNELISSGSLIEGKVFSEVGLMDESLFIDGVDHEWCWRAKKFGFYSAMSTNAKLEHMLGEGDRKILGISVAISSPFRLFYQYRNYIYLSKKGYVPFYWKLNNFIKYGVKLIYYPLFVKPRLAYLKNIFRGIRAGISF